MDGFIGSENIKRYRKLLREATDGARRPPWSFLVRNRARSPL